MVSFKRIIHLLLGVGALMISVHAASVLFIQCTSGSACLASVYFGLPQVTEPVAVVGDISQSTVPVVESEVGVRFSDVHAIVQTVGIYALLLGMAFLIILELRELKLLGRRFSRPSKARS